MNSKQKTVVVIALILFGLTLFNAPWTMQFVNSTATSSTTRPIWDAPFNSTLNLPVLFVQWVAIGIGSGVGLMLCRAVKE